MTNFRFKRKVCTLCNDIFFNSVILYLTLLPHPKTPVSHRSLTGSSLYLQLPLTIFRHFCALCNDIFFHLHNFMFNFVPPTQKPRFPTCPPSVKTSNYVLYFSGSIFVAIGFLSQGRCKQVAVVCGCVGCSYGEILVINCYASYSA